MGVMKADALAVFDHAAVLTGGDPAEWCCRQSLGSFMAGHVAAERKTAAVVLESSATTAQAWGEAGVPGALRGVVRVRVAETLREEGNLAKVKRLDEPLLLLVGARDGTTPPRLSRDLYAAAPEPKRLHVSPGAGHNDVMEQADVCGVPAFLEEEYRRLALWPEKCCHPGRSPRRGA